jgi:hypothetical protein
MIGLIMYFEANETVFYIPELIPFIIDLMAEPISCIIKLYTYIVIYLYSYIDIKIYRDIRIYTIGFSTIMINLKLLICREFAIL